MSIFQYILHLQYCYNNFTLPESQLYSLDFERCIISLHRLNNYSIKFKPYSK